MSNIENITLDNTTYTIKDSALVEKLDNLYKEYKHTFSSSTWNSTYTVNGSVIRRGNICQISINMIGYYRTACNTSISALAVPSGYRPAQAVYMLAEGVGVASGAGATSNPIAFSTWASRIAISTNGTITYKSAADSSTTNYIKRFTATYITDNDYPSDSEEVSIAASSDGTI